MPETLNQRIKDAGWWLKKQLVRRGIAVMRTPADASLPPSFSHILHRFSDAGAADAVLSFDDEPQVQRDLLSVFPNGRVVFASFPATPGAVTGFPDPNSLKPAQNNFIVEIDGETYDAPALFESLPWLCEANAVFIRCTLGFFFSGRGDLAGLEQFFRGRGFQFAELSEYFRIHLFQAPQARIILGFTRWAWPVEPAEEQSRQRRLHEALAFLSLPIARSSGLTRLAGRGSFGYPAGILNPGAIAIGDEIVLLARGERLPWMQASRDVEAFLKSCQPLIFKVNQQIAITGMFEAGVVNVDEPERTRLEDFRLFRHRNEFYSNHSTFTSPEAQAGAIHAVNFERSRIGVGISRVDLAGEKLVFVGAPKLDIPTGAAEKNWVMFNHQDELFLIYSFNPFHLLRASEWPALEFKTVHRENLSLAAGDDGLKFRNSANPVDYNEKYFLHMVHKVYPGKKYAFWAVLIEKISLRPTHISGRPLVCGWHSSPAAIIYACSLVVRADDILIFGGLNDTGMGAWRVSRTNLDANWTLLNAARPSLKQAG